jgi:hypothetical protein
MNNRSTKANAKLHPSIHNVESPSTELLSLLEYRMRAVAVGHLALTKSLAWDHTPSIEILFDGELIIEGEATAFTNAAIEAAIIHSRALLEFLGLLGKSQTQLKELLLPRRMEDDAGIEQFKGLVTLSIQNAVQSYPGASAEAEASLAYVIYLANKGIAHTTSIFTKHDQGSALLEIAFRGVPILVINSFYSPLKIDPPKYELHGRKRAV